MPLSREEATPLTENTIVNIGFYVGSAESSTLGMMVFSSADGGFQDKEAAFKDLSEFLFLCFKGKLEEAYYSACSENHPEIDTPFCPQCGVYLEREKITREDFEGWLRELPLMELHQWYPDEEFWLIHPQEGYPIEVVAYEGGEMRIADYAAKAFPAEAKWDE